LIIFYKSQINFAAKKVFVERYFHSKYLNQRTRVQLTTNIPAIPLSLFLPKASKHRVTEENAAGYLHKLSIY